MKQKIEISDELLGALFYDKENFQFVSDNLTDIYYSLRYDEHNDEEERKSIINMAKKTLNVLNIVKEDIESLRNLLTEIVSTLDE